MKSTTYGLAKLKKSSSAAAPKLNYLPPRPRRYHPKIALIGCGGISEFHLRNYKSMGLDVAMLCDHHPDRLKKRAAQFYPNAATTTDHRDVLRRDDIEIVDIATHPAARLPVIWEALEARKHVLSQKPFVTDIRMAQKLADLADERGVRLAVNQNGRWAPHWSYLTQLVNTGRLGRVASVDFSAAWDHSWVKSTPFNTLHFLVLWDFAVHWFDIAAVFMTGRKPTRIFATVNNAPRQSFAPPALVSVVADYDEAQVRWSFNASNCFGQSDRTMICGERGAAVSSGPSLEKQSVELATNRGSASPQLEGSWFTNGFQGTMGELLCAIEEKREPSNGARNNIATLELVFAALASASTGKPIIPGRATRLSGALLKQCLTETKRRRHSPKPIS